MALLCRTWLTREGGLPETKAALYRQFTEALYEWKEWKPDPFPTKSAAQKELNAVLGQLALGAIAQSASRFRLRHHQVCEALGEIDTPLFRLAMQLGWLNQVGVAVEDPLEKVYAFYHPTFEEYFAALAIDDWHFFLNHVPQNPIQGTYRFFEPQWKEVILLWLGREDVPKEQKEDFIQVLVEFEDGCGDYKFYRYRAYFLAAASLAEFVNYSRADVIVSQIVDWCFSTVANPVTEGAKAALRETDRRRMIVALTNLLRTSQRKLTLLQAAESLGQIDPGNQDAINTLSKLLREWKHPEVIQGLEQIGTGDSNLIASLTHLLFNEQRESIIRQTAESLGYIDPSNSDAINALVHMLFASQGSKRDNPWIVIQSLRKVSAVNSGAIYSLIHLLRTSQDENIRGRSIESLGQIGASNLDAITALTDLLHTSQSESTILRAAKSLEQIDSGNSDAITALTNLLRSSQDKNTRLSAASTSTVKITLPFSTIS